MFGIEKQILLNIELKDKAQYHHTTSKVTFTVHKLHLPDFLISDNNRKSPRINHRVSILE